MAPRPGLKKKPGGLSNNCMLVAALAVLAVLSIYAYPFIKGDLFGKITSLSQAVAGPATSLATLRGGHTKEGSCEVYEPNVPTVSRSLETFYDGNQVAVFKHVQPYTQHNWWELISSRMWEMDTLKTIRVLLEMKPNSYVIDFGAWVGPTAMFASSYAKHVYALEPDPGAFGELYWNVKMNPHIARKTTTMQLCISDKPGVLTMHGILGSSMMSLLENPNDNWQRTDKAVNYTDINVECKTLEQFMDEQNIPAAQVGLIKIDTEGGETRILPNLKGWLAKHKPPVLLSLHAFLFKTDTVAHEAIREVIALYKNPIWLHGGPVDVAKLNVAEDCHLCAMLLTDHVIDRALLA